MSYFTLSYLQTVCSDDQSTLRNEQLMNRYKSLLKTDCTRGFTQPFFSLWYLTANAADQRTSADETEDPKAIYLWAAYLYQNRRFHESEVPKPSGSTAPDLTFTKFPDSCEKKDNSTKDCEEFYTHPVAQNLSASGIC